MASARRVRQVQVQHAAPALIDAHGHREAEVQQPKAPCARAQQPGIALVRRAPQAGGRWWRAGGAGEVEPSGEEEEAAREGLQAPRRPLDHVAHIICIIYLYML